ncbi:MAG: hypothetical protein RR923_05500, partial [Bacilli bacterium]
TYSKLSSKNLTILFILKISLNYILMLLYHRPTNIGKNHIYFTTNILKITNGFFPILIVKNPFVIFF